MSKAKTVYLKEIEIKYRHKPVRSAVIGQKVGASKTVAALFSDLQNETKEKFITVNLDSKNRILCFEVVALGNINTVFPRPMEAFRTSVMVNAHATIVIHNHPSGDPSPGKQDIQFTKDLHFLAKKMGLSLHDHIIIGLESYYSFSDETKILG